MILHVEPCHSLALPEEKVNVIQEKTNTPINKVRNTMEQPNGKFIKEGVTFDKKI